MNMRGPEALSVDNSMRMSLMTGKPANPPEPPDPTPPHPEPDTPDEGTDTAHEIEERGEPFDGNFA